jgi:hypothetical protein
MQQPTTLRSFRLAAAAAASVLAAACGDSPLEPRGATPGDARAATFAERGARVAVDSTGARAVSSGSEGAQFGPTIPWY